MLRYLAFFLTAGFAAAIQAAPGEPGHAFDGLLGRWNCTGHFASGKAIASRMEYAADLAGKALLKHHADLPPGSYRAVESWGQLPQAGRYAMVVLDNFGGARRFTSAGWHGQVLTWQGDAGVQPAQRFIYTRLDERKYRVDWEVARDGKTFVTGDTLTCVRQD
jgi:hypothetical protein